MNAPTPTLSTWAASTLLLCRASPYPFCGSYLQSQSQTLTSVFEFSIPHHADATLPTQKFRTPFPWRIDFYLRNPNFLLNPKPVYPFILDSLSHLCCREHPIPKWYRRCLVPNKGFVYLPEVERRLCSLLVFMQLSSLLASTPWREKTSRSSRPLQKVR